MSHSIQNINDLPPISQVERISKGLALVDAIIMPDWENRYFSFNSNWDGNRGEKMASMRDGSGGEYFINFTSVGVVGKVLFEESLADVSSSLKLMPDSFSGFKNEAAFSVNNSTFFFWKEENAACWLASPESLNAYPLLGFLMDGVSSYQDWAEDYYEKSIDGNVLKEVFTSLAITENQLSVLNPVLALDDLEEDFQEILY